MVLKRVRVERTTAIEAGEPARQLRLEPGEVVRPHLVNRDEHEQRGRGRRLRGRGADTQHAGEHTEREGGTQRATHAEWVGVARSIYHQRASSVTRSAR